MSAAHRARRSLLTIPCRQRSLRGRTRSFAPLCAAISRWTGEGPGVEWTCLCRSGSPHFNDKPLIAADSNPASPFRDNIYVAWDAATGGSSSGGIRVARSIDHGVMFTVTRVDNSKGPGQGVGAIPFVGPEGEVYVAWNDFH